MGPISPQKLPPRFPPLPTGAGTGGSTLKELSCPGSSARLAPPLGSLPASPLLLGQTAGSIKGGTSPGRQAWSKFCNFQIRPGTWWNCSQQGLPSQRQTATGDDPSQQWQPLLPGRLGLRADGAHDAGPEPDRAERRGLRGSGCEHAPGPHPSGLSPRRPCRAHATGFKTRKTSTTLKLSSISATAASALPQRLQR